VWLWLATALAVLPDTPDPEQSPWEAWVASLGDALVPDATTVPGARLTAHLVVATDQQVKFLGGFRSRVQSRTADELVDVSVRPIAVDLFSFTANTLLREAIGQRQASARVPPVYVDTGDLIDIACKVELDQLAFVDPLGSRLPLPDVLTPGNHDVNLYGNVRKGTDIGAVLGLIVGGNLKARMWGPVCGSPTPGDRDLALQVINQKDHYTRWWLDHFAQGGDWETIRPQPLGLDHVRPDGVKTLRWDRPEDLAASLWHLDRQAGRAWAALRVDTPCAATDDPACREPGRAFVVLSAARVSVEPEVWLYGLDGTDQLEHDRGWPGYTGSLSRVQVAMWEALDDAIRGNGGAHAKVLANHFPIADLVLGGKERTNGVVDLFADDDVLFHLAGHTHIPELRYVDQHDDPTLARRRERPLLEYVAPSTLDFPVGAMSVALYDDETTTPSALRTAAAEVALPWAAVPVSPEVELELSRHRHRYAAYRRSVVGLQLLLPGGEHGRSTKNAGRALLLAKKVLSDDARPLMVHQFDTMLAYLGSLQTLLEQDVRDAAPDTRDALQGLYTALEAFRWRARTRVSSEWTAEGRRPREFLDLFLFDCDLGLDRDAPAVLSDSCVLQLQELLRRIPIRTRAFEFMARVADEAALADFCSGIYLDLLPAHHRRRCEEAPVWLNEVTPRP
jgi:hypothetical protein